MPKGNVSERTVKGRKGGRTDDTLLAELLLDDRVVGDGDSLTVDLGVSSLVDQLLDGLQVGFTRNRKSRRGWCDTLMQDDDEDELQRRNVKNPQPRCNQLSAWCFCKQRRPDDYSPVGDVWSDETKHLLGGLGDSNKDTVVDLQQSEKLQDLSGLGSDLGDTGGMLAKSNEKMQRTHPLIRTTK
jgi:hypothetical protein